jgi:hypothetical protein
VEKAARIDRRIAEYLAGLDESDARELDEVPSATAAALAALKAQRIELDRLATQLEAEDRNTLVEGEPDARPMGIGRGSKPPSYNVQTAVDVDTALIIHHDVTASDCMGCVLKPRCTTAERRFITRHLHEDALERMNARFRADPNLIRYRRCASEHPFGTIKRMTAGGRFLTRGFKKVGAEAALSVLAYNIIRAINLVGAVTLRAKLA